MKVRLCFFIFIFISACAKVFSQNLPEQDCISAIPVCQDTFVQTIPYSGQGLNGTEINGTFSCLLTGEKNDVWYTFTVQNSGSLCFSIIPSNTTDDYDWAVFNLTNSGCSDIFSNASLEVSCNYSNVSGITGANGLAGSQNAPCISVNSNETYVLNVSKWDILASGYTLDFSKSSAQIYDNIPPELLSVAAPATCGDTQITVIFSEKILCSSIQVSDFILNGPSGNISITNATCRNGPLYDNEIMLTVASAIAPVGNYYLILNDSSINDLCNNFNTKADTFNFSVVPFSVQTSSTPELCSTKNGTATANPLGGVSPYAYTWNTFPLQNTQTATGLSSGVYVVTISDAAGCISSATANVGFDPGNNPPVVSISSFNNATCAGINDGNATVSATGGISPYAFIWNTSPVQVSATATGLGTGNYIVTVTDSLGCKDTATVFISGGTVITVSAFSQNDTVCNGKTATLIALPSGGTAPYTVTWIGSGTNDTIVVSPASTTTYDVFATDNIGCKSDTESVVVNVLPPISASIFSAGFVCMNDSLKLTANPNGGNGNYAYSWSDNSQTAKEIWVKPTTTTTYSVTVSDNCTAADGIANTTVTVAQLPQNITVSVNQNSGCVPLEIKFQAQPNSPGYLYEWNFGDGSFPFQTANDTISHTYLSEGCKDLKLKITTGESCKDSIIELCKINPVPSPKADFIFSPENPSILNPIVNFSDQSAGAQNWQWFFGDYEISSLQNPNHEYRDSGNYIVKLIVKNNFDCSDSVEKTITVNYETTCYVPNCFTPDDNETNDEFGPSIDGIKTESYSMIIFNRNGQIVFQTENPNEKWNGKIKGEFAEKGVYVYFIKYKPLKGAEKKIYGSVTLLK